MKFIKLITLISSLIFISSFFLSCADSGTAVNSREPLEPPVVNPRGGIYDASTISLEFSVTDSDAYIRYTTDGREPSRTVGTWYAFKPISINQDTTIRLIAISYNNRSSVISERFTLNSASVAPPVAPVPPVPPVVAPVPPVAPNLALTSSVASGGFLPGGNLPNQFMHMASEDLPGGGKGIAACNGTNSFPALSWSGAPATTTGFVLIVEDNDATALNRVHLNISDIPAATTSVAAINPGTTNAVVASTKNQQLATATAVNIPGSMVGGNSWSGATTGWNGPCDRGKTLNFKLYAVGRVGGVGIVANNTIADFENSFGGAGCTNSTGGSASVGGAGPQIVLACSMITATTPP